MRVQEDAERLVVEATISNVNASVRVAQAQLIIQGREAEIPALFSDSPARWLENPPPGYVEVDTIGPATLRSGGWVWERRSGVLHYLPRLKSGLVVDGGESLQWTWVRGGMSSLRSGLQPVRQYRWRVK